MNWITEIQGRNIIAEVEELCFFRVAQLGSREERILGIGDKRKCNQHRLHPVLQHGHLVASEIGSGKFTRIVEESGTILEDKIE